MSQQGQQSHSEEEEIEEVQHIEESQIDESQIDESQITSGELVDKAILQLEEEIISKLDDPETPKKTPSRAPVKQKYRKAWESLPALKGWLAPVLNDDFSAYCKFCKCVITSHKKCLEDHAKTRKHLKNGKLRSSSVVMANDDSNGAASFVYAESAVESAYPSQYYLSSTGGGESPSISSHLHSGYSHPLLRTWQSGNTNLSQSHLMYPLFVTEDPEAFEGIPSIPGVNRFGINKMVEFLSPLVQKGLSSVLLFGVLDALPKDTEGSAADHKDSPVILAIKKLRLLFPDILVACDLCLCAYTNHGHCGIPIINEMAESNVLINNQASIQRLAQIAVAYGRAGCHIVAPSDMMDGRVGVIKQALHNAGYGSRVAVLSYACKFASCFYGPFREAAKIEPTVGDRLSYQLPPGSKGLAMRAIERDVKEGADMLMIKPAMPYLDVLKQTKEQYPQYPLFAFQVSGEYSMLHYASRAGAFDLKTAVLESLTAMRRAGADIIVTYFTPLLLDWLANSVQQVFVVVGQRTAEQANCNQIVFVEQ